MPTLPNTQALVIGIANYQYVNRLPSTVLNDAHAIHALLVDPQHCAYAPENVTLLLDQQATNAALRQAFATLATATNPDSTVLIYLSSHGGRIESGPQAGEYLLPVDARFDSDETLAQTAISGTEFTTLLSTIPARKVIVVFDCCHAAGIGQPKATGAPLFKSGLPTAYYEQLQKGRGRVILASSRSEELSWVLPGDQNSLFTKHLLAGLQGGIASEDGLIRIFDLFEYLQPRVTGDHAQQHPIFKAEIEENFPVALYLGGQKGIVAKIDSDFRYDAYISYVDKGADSQWVWETLVPKLEAAGVRVAVSGDVEEPGVARVVNIERGIRQAKRTVIVLSQAYLADNLADFENTLAQTMGIQAGTYRLLPVKIEDFAENRLPTRLGMLTTLNLAQPQRAEREFRRLIQALQGPLPAR
ncbi:MAG: caspase family protein [Caldilineaceae bacterium]